MLNQHLQYLPYGEDYIYQRNSSWNVPYTFSGKEKDAEPGYAYFGARYYDSDLSIWLSVDPLTDKYPSTSSYMYVRGNPIMLIDPNGLDDFSPKEARKIAKYERKADLIMNKNGWEWEKNRDEIHEAMHNKYKNRRFMYIKESDGNNSMDTWTSTASMVDVKRNLKSTTQQTENINLLYKTVDYGASKVAVIKSFSFNYSEQSGTAQLSLQNINSDKINYEFSVSNSEGEIASGNLSIAPITFTYTTVEFYRITYNPTDPKVFNVEIGNTSKAWAGPFIDINLSWETTVKSSSQHLKLNQTSFTRGTSFKEVVKHFSQFY
jgi:RHS repeat-associated protein